MKKVLFFGTGEFGLPILEMLMGRNDMELSGVVTQPERPVGRAGELTPGPILAKLEKLNPSFPIFTPEKYKLDQDKILEATNPDFILVCDYGQIIPQATLDYPSLGAVNIHASLLPQLRGAVPIPMAIYQGLSETGVSLQYMAFKLDAGDIIVQKSLAVSSHDNTATLKAKLIQLSLEMLSEYLPKLLQAKQPAQPQNEALATFCTEADIAKEKAEITFETSLAQAERMVRAFYPWPIAWCQIEVNGQLKRLKIFKAEVSSRLSASAKLQVAREGKELYLSLQDGCLKLEEIQLEGKQVGKAADYFFLA